MKTTLHLVFFLTAILFTACKNGPADEVSAINELTKKWNECNVRQDMQTLASLYADQVSLYGLSISKTQAISNKEDFFKEHADFNQSITGDITITKITDHQYKASFPKRSTFSGKTSDVQGYLLFEKVDRAWKITNESDYGTDKNISKNPTGSQGTEAGEARQSDIYGEGKFERAIGENQWAELITELQRKTDMIPRWADALSQSKEVDKEDLSKARSIAAELFQYLDTLQKRDRLSVSVAYKLNRNLDQALGRTLAVLERETELKNNQTVMDLQAQLEGTENRISWARQNYNEACEKANRPDLYFGRNVKANAPQVQF